VNITGDLHHYSRYARTESGHQYITCGGGGAFLHLTHNLPASLDAIESESQHGKITRKKVFPDLDLSRRLLLGNFLFPIKNPAFTSLAWLVYLYLFWLLQSHHAAVDGGFFLEGFNGISALRFFEIILEYFLGAPSLALSIGALFAGFWLFVDRVIKKKGSFFIGFLHATVQTIMLFANMYLWAQTDLLDYWGSWWGNAVIVLLFSFTGGSASALLMGVYLYLSNILLGMHHDESSSALANPNYKNFVRMKIHSEGIDIYPVGIRKVQKNWKVTGTEKEISVTGEDFSVELIEPPVYVKDSEI
jgi:hypothetical protein